MEYEYDSIDDVYRSYYDRESTYSLSIAVVMLIEAVDEIEQQEVPPLFDAIDPDALDTIFSSWRRSHRDEGYVWFVLANYEVTVFANGVIELRRREEG
jgi:Halobacterial output domain 1